MGGIRPPPQSAYEIFGWEKAEAHLPYPRSRPLNEVERKVLAKVTLPLKCDYSSLVTLVHCQGGGGCGGYTAAAISTFSRNGNVPTPPTALTVFRNIFITSLASCLRRYD